MMEEVGFHNFSYRLFRADFDLFDTSDDIRCGYVLPWQVLHSQAL